MPNFVCDLAQAPEPLPHAWEHTVGSDHALMALRADYQEQLARCHRELGCSHVRFHGLLDDDMGTLVCEVDELRDSFFNADRIMDFLLSIGMRPFVELSFMPSTLASGHTVVFHYRGNVTPPRDYGQWGTLVGKLVSHWVERYGVQEVRGWYFEVWNEPHLKAFWTGTQDDYFRLYRVTAEAIKNVDGALHVGGPATAMNAWIEAFLDYCEREHVPADFVSTHHYPTDAFGQPGDDTVDVWAVRGERALVLMLDNFALPRHALGAQLVDVRLEHAPDPRRVTVERIDAEHANAPSLWHERGAPKYPSARLVDELQAASYVAKEILPWRREGEAVALSFDLPPYGVAAVTLEWDDERA